MEKYFRRIILGFFTAICIYAGGTKPGGKNWQFLFANGLVNNGSTVSNDVVTAIWTHSPAVETSAFKWQYRETGSTNEWTALPDGLVSDGVAVAIVENATNMTFACWADWTKPPEVTTNGVYHLSSVIPKPNVSGEYIPMCDVVETNDVQEIKQ